MNDNQNTFNTLIENMWFAENADNRGLKADGKYYPYSAANGQDIGPGFDLRYQTPEFIKRAQKGMTREELNDSLIAKYKSELPFINEKFSKMGVDPTKISDEVKMGAFDIYWQRKNGLYSEFPEWWKAASKGDYNGMQRESRTTWTDRKGVKHIDNRRWEFRKKKYFQEPKATKSPLITDWNTLPQWQPPIQFKKQGGKMNLIDFLKKGSGIHIKKENRGLRPVS